MNNIKAAEAFVELIMKDQRFLEAISKTPAKMKPISAAADDISRSAAKMGFQLAAISAAIMLPVRSSLNLFSELEYQMLTVQAVTRATSKEYADLTAEARRLGAETSFRSVEVASGQVSLGRMGFSVDEIKAATPAVMDLAIATGIDLATAADYAGNTLRQFEMRADKMRRVADILTVTANSSAQTINDLGEAMKMAAPSAHAAREELEDIAAAIGLMANMGVKGTLAGTALRRIYLQMTDGKVVAQLKKYNIETTDNQKNLRKLRDIIYDIGKMMYSLPTTQRLAFANEIFETRGQIGGLAIAGSMEKFDELREKIKNADGAAAEARQRMESGIKGTEQIAISAIDEVKTSIGDALRETYIDLLKMVTKAAQETKRIIKENEGTVKGVAVGGSIIGGIAAAGLAVSGLAKIVSITGKGLAIIHKGILMIGGAQAIAAIQSTITALGVLSAKVGTIKALLAYTAAAGLPAVLAGLIAMGGFKLGGLIYQIEAVQNKLNKLLNKLGFFRKEMKSERREAMDYYYKNIAGTGKDKFGGLFEGWYNEMKLRRSSNYRSPHPAREYEFVGPMLPSHPVPSIKDATDALEKIAEIMDKITKKADPLADKLNELDEQQDQVTDLYLDRVRYIRDKIKKTEKDIVPGQSDRSEFDKLYKELSSVYEDMDKSKKIFDDARKKAVDESNKELNSSAKSIAKEFDSEIAKRQKYGLNRDMAKLMESSPSAAKDLIGKEIGRISKEYAKVQRELAQYTTYWKAFGIGNMTKEDVERMKGLSKQQSMLSEQEMNLRSRYEQIQDRAFTRYGFSGANVLAGGSGSYTIEQRNAKNIADIAELVRRINTRIEQLNLTGGLTLG